MEQLLHFLGLCPDHMSHPNLIMFLSSATGGFFGIKYIYYRWFKKENKHNCSYGCKKELVGAHEKSQTTREEKQVSVNWTAWEKTEDWKKETIDSETLQANASQAY